MAVHVGVCDIAETASGVSCVPQDLVQGGLVSEQCV